MWGRGGGGGGRLDKNQGSSENNSTNKRAIDFLSQNFFFPAENL